MDRLNNVNRPEGYYLCGENLDILNQQQDYITAVLDGLQLPGGTCVFLRHQMVESGFGGGLAYIVDTALPTNPQTTTGKIYRVDANREINLGDLLSNSINVRGIINTTYNDITIVGSGICENAYITDSCSLTVLTPQQAAEAWNFYTLETVLQKKTRTFPEDIFNNLRIIGDQEDKISFLDSTAYNNRVIRYVNRCIDVQLYFRINIPDMIEVKIINSRLFSRGELPMFPLNYRNFASYPFSSFPSLYFDNTGITIYNAFGGDWGCVGRIYL